MSTHQPQVNVHVQTGAGEVLRVASTVLLFGGAGGLAWTVAQGPNAETAASGLSMMIVMMLRFSVSAGRLRLPSSDKQDDFGANKELVSRAIDEYRGALGRASLPVMALVSALYAIGFLVLRAGVAASLGVFKNLYVAGFSAAIVGAVIIFPSLLPSIVASLKRRGVVADIPVAAQPVQPAPATPDPAPQPAPAPTPAPAKKVVRRVVKKENDNV